MFQNFYIGIHSYSALNYDVMKSYLTGVRDKKIRNGYITLETGLLYDKSKILTEREHRMRVPTLGCWVLDRG